MGDSTAISWTDSTFNPWIGCTKVGPGCDHCYAEALMDKRHHRANWGAGNPRSRTSPQNWKLPLRWNEQPFSECMECGWRGELREADGAKVHAGSYPPAPMRGCPQCHLPLLKAARRRVFCASLADVFDNEVPQEWRRDLFRLILDTPNLDWLLLTKRIGNVLPMLRRGDDIPLGCEIRLPLNVWLGATVVNQEEADRDIPKLLAVPARVRFLSIEPMLGGIDLTRIILKPAEHPERGQPPVSMDALRGWYGGAGDPARIDWVIAGGESGHHARPMHPDWVRSLRDQCQAAGVAFHFKQWGEWAPHLGDPSERTRLIRDIPLHEFDNVTLANRIGKKAAGRVLDRRTWDEFPSP